MADLVERVLQEAAERESKYKTIEVHKDIELEIDPGNLLTFDTNPLDTTKLKWVCKKPTGLWILSKT